MSNAVLAINSGSSSIKFGLFHIEPKGPVLVWKALLEDSSSAPSFIARSPSGDILTERRWGSNASHQQLFQELLDWIEGHLGSERLIAVGHRIVHGGREFDRPVRLTADVIAAIDRLTPLAPVHQSRSLEPVLALAALKPKLPQVGCFDTAFHHALSPPVSRFAIPRILEAEGLRRYGFHGLSYEYIAQRLGEISPHLPGQRTIVAHLGNGASLCAIREGRSLDTTMGFSVLDGLTMGTRCGAIDPGVLLYLQQVRGMSITELQRLLYHDSGMLGVSGVSGDVRSLLKSADPHAAEALDLFAFHVARQSAALANTMGGLDCLVFTAGIGEHASEVRSMICARLQWLGLEADPAANKARAEIISKSTSRVEVRIIPTDEELVIARHTMGLVAQGDEFQMRD
jgi:acetate kinase